MSRRSAMRQSYYRNGNGSPACRCGKVMASRRWSRRKQPIMFVTRKIRLNVSERDAATLEWMQGKCRGLYNWWVMRLRDGEQWPGWQEAKKTLQQSKAHDPELQFVYGKLLQEVYFRLHGAMNAFFRRVKNGKKPGFPRVRPRHCFFTLVYPAMYIQVEGFSLRLPTRGKCKNKHY